MIRLPVLLLELVSRLPIKMGAPQERFFFGNDVAPQFAAITARAVAGACAIAAAVVLLLLLFKLLLLIFRCCYYCCSCSGSSS